MGDRERLRELLKKREWARSKLKRAKESLGSGSWHEDANYDLADNDFRVWSVYLENLEEEIEKLKKEGR